MPKYETHHPAGNPTSKELRELLLRFFKEKDVERLERLGGRIMISLTVPYTPRRKGSKKHIDIGEQFVLELRTVRDEPLALKDKLKWLSVKQLRELGKFIGHPLRTKSARQEIVEELVSHFHGEEVWKRISNIE